MPAIIGCLGNFCLIIGGVLGMSPLVVEVEILVVVKCFNFPADKSGVSAGSFSPDAVVENVSSTSEDSYNFHFDNM